MSDLRLGKCAKCPELHRKRPKDDPNPCVGWEPEPEPVIVGTTFRLSEAR